MKQYFQAELNLLRQAGRAFAQAHPSIAPHLGEVRADPDVARLLEGCAYLSAQIQAQSDAWVPDLIYELLQVVAPQLQMPSPSCVVVQLCADRKRLRGRHVVDAGFAMQIVNPEGAVCAFRTTEPCSLGEADTLTCHLQRTGQASHRLVLDVRVLGHQGVAALAGRTTRVFVSGDYAQASGLWLAIVAHTTRASLWVDDMQTPMDARRCLRAAEPRQNRAAQAPSTHFVAPGSVAMRHYFNQPEAQLFFDIEWPEAVLQHTGATQVQIELDIDGARQLSHQLAADALKLHCVTAINLFEASAMPIRQDGFLGPQLLRPEPMGQTAAEVCEVLQVTGICDATFERVHYQPFVHSDTQTPSPCAYYQVHKKYAAGGGAPDTYLSAHTPCDAPPDIRAQTLSIRIACSSNAAARGIGMQTPCRLPKPGYVASAHTVSAASTAKSCAQAQSDGFKLLGHMSLLRPISDLRAHLQAQLRSLADAVDAQSAQSRAHAQRIDGIRALEETCGYRMIGGIAAGCANITLTLDSDCFVSVGDAFVFASLIDAMLHDARGINRPHTLRVVMLPYQQSYALAPRGLGRSL